MSTASMAGSPRQMMVIEAIAILIAGVAAAFLLRGHSGPSLGESILLASLGVAARYAVQVRRVERAVAPRHWPRRARWLLGLVVQAGLPSALAAFVLFGPQSAATWLGAWLAAAALTLSLFGGVGRIAQAANPGRRQRVIVVGATELAQAIVQALQAGPWAKRYEVVGVFDQRGKDRRAEQVGGIKVRSSMDALREMSERNAVDVILLVMPPGASSRIDDLAFAVQTIPTDVLVPSAEGGNAEGEMVTLAGVDYRLISRRPMSQVDLFVKAVEDRLLALLALLVAGPFMLWIGLLIRLEDGGPAFFRQTRVGRYGRPFEMLKFRTMALDLEDDGSAGTRRDDPRVTRIGRMLRAWSIDELPQLINVLRGEMSIVGPRAHVPNMLVADRNYADAVRAYTARSRVKPGITGWAQVNGMRGGIHNDERAHRSVELDLYYVDNWSLWLDIRIMVRTVLFGMRGQDIF